MFAICVESSHQRGMGHLFRQLNFARLLAAKGERCVFLVNADPSAAALLAASSFTFETVNLPDFSSGWEAEIARRHGVKTWINDRLDTDERHSARIKALGLPLVTFDDRGSGAALADFNFAALSFDSGEHLKGKAVFTGTDYLILNPEIDRFKKPRQSMNRIIVTLGGSDTYGATVKAVNLLARAGLAATVITGPSFAHHRELAAAAGPGFEIKKSVPSLIEEFSRYDLAVTGGGITPFEANASGLPCVIIANELFEIPNAKHLERLGSSVFAGHHAAIDPGVLARLPDIGEMSRRGLAALNTKGADKIYNIISNA